MINLLSDTVTKPTPDMLNAMMNADVGDDVFGEDPSVNHFQEKIADMFGYKAAMFVPSGTMANQIALKVHTQPLDEIICHELSHIYKYELGGYGFHSGAAIQLLSGEGGILNAKDVASAIKPDVDWYPTSRLVSLENTVNMAGGNYYTLEQIRPIAKVCNEKNLALHCDGARLFNAMIAGKTSPMDHGELFDSISICMSKGLGAPVGSVLMGSADFIKKSRKVRKAMGGGMRQAGYLAAACTYALDHHVDRLAEDHAHAKMIGVALEGHKNVDHIEPIKTNIVIFKVKNFTAEAFVNLLANKGVKAAPISFDTVRFVLHLDISMKQVEQTIEILHSL